MWGFNVSSSNATITSYKATSFPGGLTETATSDSNNIQRVDPYITVHNLTMVSHTSLLLLLSIVSAKVFPVEYQIRFNTDTGW